MNTFKIINLVVIYTLTTIFSVSAQLADSTWPMFRHDLKNTGRSSLNGPRIPVLKWKFRIGNSIFSSPAIGEDEIIYIGSAAGSEGKDSLFAINSDGTLLWKFITEDLVFSPTFAKDGVIIFGSGDYLYSINSDGTLQWKFKVDDWTGISSPAIGSDGTIYVGSEDHQLYAINPDGNLKWKFKQMIILFPHPL